MKRIIAHLDMDAFFASVEEAHTPSFKGKPIVVGTEPNFGQARGVVSTANYKARAYGIHSALPISQAWKLSEEAKKQNKEPVIFLPVDFELYNKVSENIHQIILNYAKDVEQASIDEFYFDLSFAKTFAKAKQICQKIKKEIISKEKITCSVGIAPNKLVSKIAAGINKPNGMLLVTEKEVLNFLNPLPIRELPGIGPKTAEIFYAKNIKIIKDINKFSLKELRDEFGKQGENIYFKAKGIDNLPVTNEHEVKSIGEHLTFSTNSLEAEYILNSFKKVSNDVFLRFKNSGFPAFKTINITVRFSNFQTLSRSKSLKNEITAQNKKTFDLEILKLILPFLDKRSNPNLRPIRLIGVRVENFVSQKNLL